jgi:hypothetical protein
MKNNGLFGVFENNEMEDANSLLMDLFNGLQPRPWLTLPRPGFDDNMIKQRFSIGVESVRVCVPCRKKLEAKAVELQALIGGIDLDVARSFFGYRFSLHGCFLCWLRKIAAYCVGGEAHRTCFNENTLSFSLTDDCGTARRGAESLFAAMAVHAPPGSERPLALTEVTNARSSLSHRFQLRPSNTTWLASPSKTSNAATAANGCSAPMLALSCHL